MLQILLPFHVEDLLAVSVLVSSENQLGLSAGQFNELLGTVLFRFGVCWASVSCTGDMSTLFLVLLMFSFCLRSLCWLNFRLLRGVWSGQVSIHMCFPCWACLGSAWNLHAGQVEVFWGFFAEVLRDPAVVPFADWVRCLLGVNVLFNLVDLLRYLLSSG